MSWTAELPTKPGFYYWQGGRLIGQQVVVVQISAFKDASKPLVAEELCTSTMGLAYKNAPKTGPVKDWGGRWAGPLPEPEDLP